MINRLRPLWAQIQDMYRDPLDRQRAYGLSLLNLFLIFAWLLGAIVFVVLPLSRGEPILGEVFLTLGALPLVILFSQRLIQAGRLRWAVWLFMALLMTTVLVLNWPGLDQNHVVLFALPIIAAVFLLNRRETGALLALLIATAFIVAVNQSQNTAVVQYRPAAETLANLIYMLIVLAAASVLLLLFSGGAGQVLSALLNRMSRLDDVDELNRQLARVPDENSALLRLAELVVDTWAFNFMQVHLFDSGNQLLSYRRTGVGTRHAISPSAIGSASALAQAINSKEVVLISPHDPAERQSHFVPSSNFGLLIPLLSGNHVIGLLDVQSNRFESPFGDADRSILKLAAGSFTAALVHIREKAQLEQALREQDKNSRRLQSQIAELKGLSEHKDSGWHAYLQSRGKDAYGFNLQGEEMTLVPAHDLPPDLRSALMKGDIVVETTASAQLVSIPIHLRNETLGAMTFSLPKDQLIHERQLEMARIVAQRLAVALENARLVEQTQLQAQRERKAGEIGNILISHQNFNQLLDVAARSFSEALGAVYTHIDLEHERLVEAHLGVSQDGDR